MACVIIKRQVPFVRETINCKRDTRISQEQVIKQVERERKKDKSKTERIKRDKRTPMEACKAKLTLIK